MTKTNETKNKTTETNNFEPYNVETKDVEPYQDETENTKSEKFTKQEIYIGSLLMVPLYILIILLSNILPINLEIPFFVPILIYLPVFIGLVLSFKHYKYKSSKPLAIFVIFFVVLSTYFFHLAYDIEYEGWHDFEYIIYYFVCAAATKISSCLFFKRIVGWKKSLLFLTPYGLLLWLSFILG